MKNRNQESNTIIFEHRKDDTTKINVESKIVIQLENNKQINSDEESDYSENKNQYEQDRRLRNRNKIRRLDRLRYGNIVITEQHESKSYDAITCSNAIKWKIVMDDEIDSLRKNQT